MASGFGPASAHANRSSTEYLGKAAVHILAINACASHNEDRSAMNFQAYQKWTITQETGLQARYWLRLGRHWEIMLLRQLYQPINQSNRGQNETAGIGIHWRLNQSPPGAPCLSHVA
jgi:hypothetical protein